MPQSKPAPKAAPKMVKIKTPLPRGRMPQKKPAPKAAPKKAVPKAAPKKAVPKMARITRPMFRGRNV